MSLLRIYSASTGKEITKVKSFEYSGSHMGERSIKLTVTSPRPIAWEIGDYLFYRGERFELNTIPAVSRNSRSNTNGESLKYDSMKFDSLANELVRCMFLDIVLRDNQTHYTSLPNFAFYAENVTDLAERIKANLDRLYNNNTWSVRVAAGVDSAGDTIYINIGEVNNLVGVEDKSFGGETDVNVSVDNINCWEVLALVNSQFKLEFLVNGREITIGKNEWICKPISSTMSYGKGNGLITIEKNVDQSQEVITRLRAYGNTKNLPSRYYATLNQWHVTIDAVSEVEGKKVIRTNILGAYDKYFSDRVRFSINGRSFYADKVEQESGYVTFKVTTASYNNLLVPGTNIARFTAGVDTTGLMNASGETYFTQYAPNNMAVNRLMLPGFPMTSLNDMFDDEEDHVLSENPLDPYIGSLNEKNIGIREFTVYADGSNEDFDDIYPSIEGMTAGELPGYSEYAIKPSLLEDKNTNDESTMKPDTRVDEVDGATQIQDSGIVDGDYYEEKQVTSIGSSVTINKTQTNYDVCFTLNLKEGIHKFTTNGLAKVTLRSTVTEDEVEGVYSIYVVSPSGKRTTSSDFSFKVAKDSFYMADINNFTYNASESGVHKICLSVLMYGNTTPIRHTFDVDDIRTRAVYLTQEIKLVPNFKIYLKDIGFNPDGYSENDTFTISMKSGMCCGRDFEVYAVKETANGLELSCKRQLDDVLNLYFPYNGYNIQPNDRFVLTGIFMPDVYVQAASNRLYEQAKAFLDANDSTAYTYTPKVDDIFLAREHDECVRLGFASIYQTIHEGNKVHIVDTELGINAVVTIDQLTIREGNALIPQYTITLRDEKDVSTIKAIQNKLSEITNGMRVNNTRTNNGGVVIISSDSIATPSDTNVYSALRSDTDFLKKTRNEYTDFDMSVKNGEVRGELTVNGKTNTTDIINMGEVSTKNLKVTGRAEFFELMIEKIKAAGGSIMLTPADGFKVDYVQEDEGTGDKILYWNASDGETETSNMWMEGDQALCMNFHTAKTGVTTGASNKYFWAVVDLVGTHNEDVIDGDYIDVLAGQYEGTGAHLNYHYIRLNSSDYDGDLSPEVGDEVVMCGHRGNENPDRQSAIYISSVSGLDQDLVAPFFAQYSGINNFNLSTHRQSFFDATGADIIGNFRVGPGKTVEQYVDEKIADAGSIELHTYYAYAKTPTGGFMTTSQSAATDDAYPYIGICVSTAATQPTVPTEYTWTKKGENTEFYKLVDYGSSYTCTIDKKTSISLKAYVVFYSNQGPVVCDSLPTGYVAIARTSAGDIMLPVRFEGGYLVANQTGLYIGANTPTWAGLVLKKGDVVVDSFSVPLSFTPGVVFDINQELRELSIDIYGEDGQFSEFKQRENEFEIRVSDVEVGYKSEIKSTADAINMTVTNLKNDIKSTGINIQDRSIEMTADKFVLNNNNGERVLEADENGNVSVTGTINATDGVFEGKLRASAVYNKIIEITPSANPHYLNPVNDNGTFIYNGGKDFYLPRSIDHVGVEYSFAVEATRSGLDFATTIRCVTGDYIDLSIDGLRESVVLNVGFCKLIAGKNRWYVIAGKENLEYI